MAIGTSDGEYFDSQHHMVAVDTKPKIDSSPEQQSAALSKDEKSKNTFENFPDDQTYDVLTEKYGKEATDSIKWLDDTQRQRAIRDSGGKSIDWTPEYLKYRKDLIQELQYGKDQPVRPEPKVRELQMAAMSEDERNRIGGKKPDLEVPASGGSGSGKPVGWHIIDKQTGQVVGKGTNSRGVDNKIDKMDNAYGSYNYRRRAIYDHEEYHGTATKKLPLDIKLQYDMQRK